MFKRRNYLVLAVLFIGAFLMLNSNLYSQEAPKGSETPAVVAPAGGASADAVKDATVANGTEAVAAADGAAEKAAEAVPAEDKNECDCMTIVFKRTFWAVIPALLAIVLALITKEAYSSLFIGVLVGGLFVKQFNFIETIDFLLVDGLIKAVSDTAGIFIFLVLLGILVALINKTGAASAFGRWAQEHVKSRAGAMFATFLLGILIFIDDYFNCLTVGSVMLPVTDSKRISRAKLSYLIDATAAPVCMIAPISSWAAAVSAYAEGTEYTGLELFCRAIPFNFYSLLTFVFILCIIFFKLDFGSMAVHERNAIQNGDLFTNGSEVDNGERPAENAKGRIYDMIFPIVVLISVSVCALVHVGGYSSKKGFIAAFSDTDATVGLPMAGLVALVVTVLYLLVRQVIKPKDAMDCVPAGFKAMVPAILILTLATTLKNMTGALELKEYIADLMSGAATYLTNYLPVVIFLVACVLAFATGTSWGTFGILIPIVVSIFPSTSPLLFIGMSACLAGAVCGDHCSPISDTTIMSSAGARCMHLNHVSTQLPYAIFVAVFSAIGFLIAGFFPDWYVVFPTVAVLMVLTLFGMRFICKADCEGKIAC